MDLNASWSAAAVLSRREILSTYKSSLYNVSR